MSNILDKNCSYCDGSGVTGPSGEPPQPCLRCSGTGRETFGLLLTPDLEARLDEMDKNIKLCLEVCEKILANLP